MSTFSIIARCQKTAQLGVCTATGAPSVRDRVPFVEAGVGAVATQALTEPSYGVKGLKLLKQGIRPQDALEALLKGDPLKEFRQVIMIDVRGRAAAFTGGEVLDFKGHKLGRDCVAAGNLLTNVIVIDSIIETFEGFNGSLAERLLKAIKAGEKAGGDKRGLLSAALIVVNSQKVIVDLRVDVSFDPIKDLEVMLISAAQRQAVDIAER